MAINVNNGPPQNLFARIDSNGDGKADRTELEAFQKVMQQQHGGRAPPISVDQLLKMGDADGDGALSSGEMPGPRHGSGGARGGQWGDQSTFERGGRPNPQEMFARVDTNGDGKIEREEHEAFAAQMGGNAPSFDQMLQMGDRDGDGALSSNELPRPPSKGGFGAGGMPSPQEMFARIDANGDGKIQREEHEAFAAQMPGGQAPSFDQILAMADQNGDGAIGSSEVPSGQSGLSGQSNLDTMRQQVMAVLAAERLRRT